MLQDVFQAFWHFMHYAKLDMHLRVNAIYYIRDLLVPYVSN